MDNAASRLHKTFPMGYQINQCDFMSVLRSFKVTPLSSFLDEPKRYGSLNEAFSYISKRVSDWMPCTKDEYSRLRYATFFLEQCEIVDEQLPQFYNSNERRRRSGYTSNHAG